jgi:metallo-beta-lactamase family protein
MADYELIHLGGEFGVTGSCHLLVVDGVRILVDCGMAQGDDRVAEMAEWPVRPGEIDYLFLTHAHMDHIGRVPELVESGFDGEIICTPPTKALLEPLLRDGLGFTDWPRRKIKTCLKRIEELSWGFEYGRSFSLKKGISFSFGNAGHILGSCFIRFELPGAVVVFSGDLGAKDTPILPDPEVCGGCDLLVMESTYGDRLHGERAHRVARLRELLRKVRGKVLIPAFALGRTQELLYELDRIGVTLPVFVDTPLGLKITRIYERLKEFWDREAKALDRAGDDPLDFASLYAVKKYRYHEQLLGLPGPAIIIAGSGMCSGGRIIDYLQQEIENPETEIFFVGYQAEGTLGRQILRYHNKPGGYVVIGGERLRIRARVRVLTGYSAHADQAGLLEWVEAMKQRPGRIKLVHGEKKARETLAGLLEKRGFLVA